MTSRPLIPIIAGPTAVGKTSVSLQVAKALNAEIISADSRQIYKEFSIGTASPSVYQLKEVKHHLVQEIAIGEGYSSGIFANRVASVANDILLRDKGIVITGGSTLYIHALLNGLSDIPKVDPLIRVKLNERLENEGSKVLYEELLKVDPNFAQTLDATKSQRIIRGLEVFLGTGEPISSFHGSSPLPTHRFKLFVLYRERKRLYERIDERVNDMISAGLIEEIQAVLETDPNLEDNAFRTIGIQELIPYLKGETSLEEAVLLIKRNSRRYAKRQLTWFKRYPEAIWIDVDEKDPTKAILGTTPGD